MIALSFCVAQLCRFEYDDDDDEESIYQLPGEIWHGKMRLVCTYLFHFYRMDAGQLDYAMFLVIPSTFYRVEISLHYNIPF
jgi:hypothetical protein